MLPACPEENSEKSGGEHTSVFCRGHKNNLLGKSLQHHPYFKPRNIVFKSTKLETQRRFYIGAYFDLGFPNPLQNPPGAHNVFHENMDIRIKRHYYCSNR